MMRKIVKVTVENDDGSIVEYAGNGSATIHNTIQPGEPGLTHDKPVRWVTATLLVEEEMTRL